MSAVVTRYPTGVFGIAHQGHMFWTIVADEQEVRKKLREAKIPNKSVKWEERYYDGDCRIADNYKTRRYTIQNPHRK